MEAAGVVLAIVATTDLCLKYGRVLIETCATFKGAVAQVDERILRVEHLWKRTVVQLEFLKRIWRCLDEEHQTIQTQTLYVLNGKLKVSISKLDSLRQKESDDRPKDNQLMTVKRLRYIGIKKHLDESIESLASWQQIFDPSWYLILKISSPFVDQELLNSDLAISPSTTNSVNKIRDALKAEPPRKVSVFLPEDDIDNAEVVEIPFSSAKRMQRAGKDTWRVIDHIPCESSVEIDLLTRDVRDLARKLKSVDSFTFGILQCHGVVKRTDVESKRLSSFDFIFNIPPELNQEPQSLRSYLYSDASFTLTSRFELAKRMARSISYVHTLGFVHKNVRPETILGFKSTTTDRDHFFLIGFENVRMADGRTLRSGDSAWEKNLYRHPLRQGLNPEENYVMQHDIYSLGVCLLEIGLWESFLSLQDASKIPLPSATLEISIDGTELKQPLLMKDHLVNLANRELPKRVGERYSDVVVNCLTCLDEDNVDFGSPTEFEDQDGILLGVKYIEKILLKLNEILA